MTIFQLIQKPQMRGAEMFAAQLATELTAKGHHVLLISLFPGDSQLPFPGQHILLNRPQHKRWNDLEGWRNLAKLIEQYQPDVIQCNAGDTLKFAVLSKLTNRWKTPIIARNASMVSAYITNPITKWINRFLYRKTKAIISVSQLSAQDINQLFPETKSKTSVIPVGINLPNLQPVSWQNSPKSEINLIHVGGFSFEKNHVGLFSIFQKFLKEKPNSHLHLLGDGPLRKEMEEKITQLGLQNAVTFYGFTSQVMDYIHQADVLLLPSIIEGLPGVLLEAMYAETPVVAYNVGGISEIVFPNETGYLLEKGDEPGFVKAILDAVQTANTSVIVKNAKELVVAKFNNSYLATQFEQVYKSVLHDKN